MNKIVTIQSNYITQEDAKKVHQFIWDKKAKVFREGNVYLVKKDIYYKGINDTGNFPSDANLIVLYNGRTKQEMDRKTSVHQLKAVDRVRELQRMLYRMFLFHTAVKQMKNKETRRALAEFIYDIKQNGRSSEYGIYATPFGLNVLERIKATGSNRVVPISTLDLYTWNDGERKERIMLKIESRLVTEIELFATTVM